MRNHDSHCVTLGTARRIIALGRLAVGYPLPSGEWSVPGAEPFTHGELVRVRIMSKKGGKVHAVVEAVVLDCREGDKGCFVAHFIPMREVA